MKTYPTLKDVAIEDVYKDLNTVMYMLHHLNEEAFSKKEITEVCFALKVTLNSLEVMMEKN